MNHKRRILDAIGHRRPDRTPCGDLAITNDLLRALIGDAAQAELSPRERLGKVWTQLDADLVNVHQFPMRQVGRTDAGLPIFRSVLGDEHVITEGSSHLHRAALDDIAEAKDYQVPDPATCLTDDLDWWVARGVLFTFAQIMGPISALDWMLGTEDYLVWCMTNTQDVLGLSEKVVEYELSRARTFLDHGADAILIADDMAYNTGMFLPPAIMDELAWPIYKDMIRRIKQHRDVPVFLHTDGDIRSALPRIVECGFDGLHSLQPSASMDIEQVKRDYGDKLCLMGNLDLDRLMPFGSPDEVTAEARRLCETIGSDGGFILSTCNILIGAIPPENVRAMYRAVNIGSPSV